MSDTTKRFGTKAIAVTALTLGLAAGGYGVAQAADSGTGTAASTTGTTAAAASQPSTPPTSGNPWGGQRSDETLLTGDAKAKVEAAAVAKVGSGATVVRVETDADGHAAYEVHMTKSDGTPVTVYVDKSFEVVGVETR
jgi:hypothetical protein